MRAGRPWNAMRSRARSSQRFRCASSGKQLLQLAIGREDVLRIAGQRDPAERPLAAAEQRPDVRGHEARESRTRSQRPHRTRPGGCCCRSRRSECPSLAGRSIACTCVAQLFAAASRSAGMLRRIGLRRAPLRDRPARRQIAVDEIVRGRLVGDEVGARPARGAHDARSPGRDPRRCRAGRSTSQRLATCTSRSSRARRRGRAPARRGSACAGGTRCGPAGTRC